MAAVSSGYVEIDITATTGDTTLPIRLTGDFQAPDRYHLTMELRGIVKLWEIIAIGEDFYRKSLPNGAWEAGAESPIPFGNLFDYGAFDVTFDPNVAAGLSLSEEQLNGERVYRVGGAVPGDTLADLLDDPQVTDGEGEVEYWIGIEDSLVRKTTIQVELPSGNGASGLNMQIVMTLSDYGKPVEIQVPEL